MKGIEMLAKDAIRNTLDMSERTISAYIGDLEDSDLLIRPVEGTNHMAWQLGHLIQTEHTVLEMIRPGAAPALPQGFAEGHGRECFTVDDPAKFLPVATYQELWKGQRATLKAILDSLSEEDLDAPSPERFKQIAPTMGTLLNLMGMHGLMHAGQFVAVRRLRKKPITI
jgi:hypothetical protein